MTINGRVLLLNQTYEPLGTVGVARAMVMLFNNSVTVEEWDGDRVLRTPRVCLFRHSSLKIECRRRDLNSY